MRHRRLALSVVLSLAAFAASAQPGPATAAHPFGASRPIDGQYIVVFRPEVTNPAALAAQLTQQYGGQRLHTYSNAIKGFAARLPAAAAQALRNDPNVDFVEQDATISLNETKLGTPAFQQGATWGIDRVDQASPGVSGSYQYQYTGAGVYAFVIDTGILSSHTDFGGRVHPEYGTTAIGDGLGTSDCNGHGTHVSGTIGGATWGVAKGVTLVPVRVLDCSGSGTTSGVISGIDWVAKSSLRPAVANMSLGGGFSSALNSAVAGAVSANVTMVVAAGNSNADACSYSPSSEPTAITVGATSQGSTSDPRASYSNYGTCVDVFAPGSGITSAWIGATNQATNTISGTSMAAPHVTGVAALALAANGGAGPQNVADFLIANATTGTIAGAGTGSPNRMVFSMAPGAPGSAVSRRVGVTNITGASTRSGSNWRATATVTVNQFDGSSYGVAIAGATVSGTFTPGGNASCVTGNAGSCKLTSGTIGKSTSMASFAVTDVKGSLISYDKSGSDNIKTMISVQRPF